MERLGSVTVGVSHHSDWIRASLSRNGDLVAALAGNLDNADDVRAELVRAGDPPAQDASPAAVLLAAWKRWGEEAVSRLRGAFSGVVTDGHQVYLFRDAFGNRPLFQHGGPGGLYAATEVKQVLAGAPLTPEPDLDHLHGILFGGIETSTSFRGVERVPKAHVGVAGPGPGLSLRRYWDPACFVDTIRIGPDEARAGVVEHLERAVRRTLTGHDAVLLSGGLDSPSVAAFAARAEGLANPVQAVTSIYPDFPSVDEREWTEMAARHVGMDLHPFVAKAGSLDDVEEWVRMVDGPVDLVSIPEAAEAYRAARATTGARTILNGEIAEFVFEVRGYLLDHLIGSGKIRSAAQVVGWSRARGRSWKRVLREVGFAAAPGGFLAAWQRRRPRVLMGVPPWIDEDRLRATDTAPPVWALSPRERWRAVQPAPLGGPGIGFEADEICSAVCGVDSRRPFADQDLWEFVLSLPAEVKFPTARPKPLLRESMRGILPDALIDRKDKTVFNEFHVAKADYPTLRRLLLDPNQRVEGVDYTGLAARLDAAEMTARELQWARDVARIHAFLNQW